jgi:Zn-dependent protease with chaperone function
LTAPSAAFRRSAWLATAGLLGFVGVYFGLMGYCALTTYRLVVGAKGALGCVIALPLLFVFGFLVRGLFVVKHASTSRDVEIFEADEPRLFSFLHRLADETGAPRPHRVFLSAEVNACVFYDLSFWNLIVPSKKNLVLGLGLVNVLSLDELKAVVAHEFGHFAQKTMAVGRWVYVARQIAGNIVVARTGFDRVLDFLSRIDLRVAWIGWGMRLVLWAIRAVLDTVLRVVVLAHRALGRHMELQADRVAVSVSGSDSLIHALHRLGPADEAWHEAVRFALEEQRAGRPVEDLFALEAAALEHLRRVLDEPTFGATPARPEGDLSAHRVFAEALANPPRMWATHPPNRDREESAKAVYLPSVLDARSAFGLFTDPLDVRRRVTRAMFAPGPDAPEPAKPLPEPAPLATSLAAFEERFARAALDPRYRGMYLDRPLAAYHASLDAMTGGEGETTPEAIRARLEALYPTTLRKALAKLRECREEEVLLEGLADGVLRAPGGLIRHRGEEIRRADLPSVIARVREERRGLEAELVAHDVSSRRAHLDAARLLGGGWAPYLEHLLALLHFATHASRKLDDAFGYLAHVVDIVLADGHVSASERKRVLEAANDLHVVLSRVFEARGALAPPSPVTARFDRRGGCKVLNQRLGLGEATPENLGDWLAAADGWARGSADDLRVLAETTLDELLEAERHVARSLLDDTDPGAAPEPGAVPSSYPGCVVGAERPRQKRLGAWDRFQLADGVVPGLARLGVASAVLLPAMFFGTSVGTASVHAHNGLSAPVEVTIAGRTETVGPYETKVFEADARGSLHVEARAVDGRLIEAFDAPEVEGFGDYVYNVARAATLVHWTATYGSAVAPSERPMGAPRWLEASEEVIFEDPPESISTKSGGGTRTVLTAVSGPDVSPSSALSLAGDPAERSALMEAHLAWEPGGSEALTAWAEVVEDDSPALARLVARAESEPDDLALQVLAFEHAKGEAREAGCARYRARAAEAPDDPGRAYLANLCIEELGARREAVLSWFARDPRHPWLAWSAATVLAGGGSWGDALRAWDVALAGIQTPLLASSVASEAIRTRRVAAAAGFEVDPSWRVPDRAHFGAVGFLEALDAEEGADDPPLVLAFRRLRAGDLAGAVTESEKVGGAAASQVLALAGASEGADEPLRERALALGTSDLGAPTLGALAALAQREGADAAPFFAALDEALAPTRIEGLAEALAAPDLGAAPARLEALVEGHSLRTVALVKAMGVVVLGDRAPKAWRDGARVALFEYERPYLR